MTTIRRRLLLLLLPALALLMFVGGVVDYRVAVATTQDAYDQVLASRALAFAAYLRVDQGRLRLTSLAPLASVAGATTTGNISPDDTLYAVSGPSGELIAGSPGLPGAFDAKQPAHTLRVQFADIVYQGTQLRVASVLVPTILGVATVTVGQASQRRVRTQQVMLFGKLLVDFAELDITLLLIWIAVHYGLKPLSALRDEVERRSIRELEHFDETQVPGELRAVVVAFNRVLELLHDAAQVQQRFIADAAHQLRTPVAGVMAQIELLVQDSRAQPIAPELAKVQRAIQALSHTANQLLALARAEPAGTMHTEFQPVVLEALVKELVERFLERADRLGIDLGAELTDVTVLGDAWLLEELLSSLLDNALKYTPTGGHVTVRAGIENRSPYLEVEDNGPGIPEAERQRVRERFYRRPGSPGMGCGLGLAIVEEIARAHQATLTIGTGQQGHGARMRVRFQPSA